MSRVAGASTDARATAVDSNQLADTLAVEAENLDAEVRRFLTDVQAALEPSCSLLCGLRKATLAKLR